MASDGQDVTEWLEFLTREYGTPEAETKLLGRLLMGTTLLEKFDFPPSSPWKNPRNIKLLSDRIAHLAKRGESTPSDEDAATFEGMAIRLFSDRLIECIDAALPVDDSDAGKTHLALTRICIALLADRGFASKQQTLDWVQEWLTSKQGVLLEPSLAAVLNAAPMNRLEDISAAFFTFLEEGAERAPETWLPSLLYVAWAQRSRHQETLLAQLERAEQLPGACTERLFRELLRPEIEQSLRTVMLPQLLRLADLQRARVMLLLLDNPTQQFMVPGLVAAGVTARKTTTQLAILRACVRIGSPIAEPLIIELLQTAAPGMKYNAVDAAGAICTRQCLIHLSAIVEEGSRLLADRARIAMEAIEARYPASDYAARGSLTLSEDDGVSGALSLALGDAGAVTLYREAEAEAARTVEPVVEASARAKMAREPSIYRLDVPPRKLGLNLLAACFYQNNLAGLLTLLVPVIAPVAVGWYSNDLGTPLTVIFCVALALGVFKVFRLGKRLKYGQPAYVEHLGISDVTRYDHKSGMRKHAGYNHAFEFMTETGELVETSRRFSNNALAESVRERIKSGAEEPVLYVPGEDGEESSGGDVLFLPEQKHIEVDKQGNLVPSSILGKLYWVLILVHILLTIFVWGRYVARPILFRFPGEAF